jgi:hypothetical protein
MCLQEYIEEHGQFNLSNQRSGFDNRVLKTGEPKFVYGSIIYGSVKTIDIFRLSPAPGRAVANPSQFRGFRLRRASAYAEASARQDGGTSQRDMAG